MDISNLYSTQYFEADRRYSIKRTANQNDHASQLCFLRYVDLQDSKSFIKYFYAHKMFQN